LFKSASVGASCFIRSAISARLAGVAVILCAMAFMISPFPFFLLMALLSAYLSYNPHYYNARGLAYEKKGDNDRAMADFEKAVSLTPKNAEYDYRGNIARLRYGPVIRQTLDEFTSPGRSVNSVEALAVYLKDQPVNSPDKPI
jgi:tetratricopeptide (TPR) repeat protein